MTTPSEVGGAAEPLRVLFVCTANISRSPYAERRSRALLGDAPVEVASAGVAARGGFGLDEAMVAQLAARGEPDAAAHLSQAVTSRLMADADLVLTFEFGQHMRLLDSWPEHAGKVFGFQQFLGGVREVPARSVAGDALALAGQVAPRDSVSLDVGDPYRRGKRAAGACADEIDAGLADLVPFLVAAARGRALGAGAPQHAAPMGSEPQRVIPQHALPRGAAPQHALPQHAGPQHAGPQHALPQGAGPQHALPQGAAPQHAAPSASGYRRRPASTVLALGMVSVLGGAVALLATAPGSSAWLVGLVALAGGAAAAASGLVWRARADRRTAPPARLAAALPEAQRATPAAPRARPHDEPGLRRAEPRSRRRPPPSTDAPRRAR